MGRFVTHMLDMLEGVGLSLEQILLVKISNFLSMDFRLNTFARHLSARIKSMPTSYTKVSFMGYYSQNLSSLAQRLHA